MFRKNVRAFFHSCFFHSCIFSAPFGGGVTMAVCRAVYTVDSVSGKHRHMYPLQMSGFFRVVAFVRFKMSKNANCYARLY